MPDQWLNGWKASLSVSAGATLAALGVGGSLGLICFHFGFLWANGPLTPAGFFTLLLSCCKTQIFHIPFYLVAGCCS